MGKMAFRYEEGHSKYLERGRTQRLIRPSILRVSEVKSLAKVAPWVYEGGTIFYGSYTKGVPFLSKMAYERVRVCTLGRSLPV